MKALSVKNISVSYYTVKPEKLASKLLNRFKKQKFTALKDISFDIEKGSIVGIIGSNGAGKSTLLKTIANVFEPDTGSIDLYGNSVSLLSLGVGFERELTGYENIILSGLLMGYSKKEVLSYIDEIIEFSELKEFIYNPVKTYSSGMYSKLAFSISSILDSDILLIDEIMSVGDIHFKEKSFNKTLELINDKQKTVLIVSHITDTILDYCDKAIWIEEGKIRLAGGTKKVVKEYEKYMKTNSK